MSSSQWLQMNCTVSGIDEESKTGSNYNSSWKFLSAFTLQCVLYNMLRYMLFLRLFDENKEPDPGLCQSQNQNPDM